jgi:hypothetical protein
MKDRRMKNECLHSDKATLHCKEASPYGDIPNGDIFKKLFLDNNRKIISVSLKILLKKKYKIRYNFIY